MLRSTRGNEPDDCEDYAAWAKAEAAERRVKTVTIKPAPIMQRR
jgi:hypothetical protein